LVARAEGLTPVRVASVFAEIVEPRDAVSATAADDGQMDVLDKSRSPVLLDDVSVNDGCTYYEQLLVATGWVKLGRSCCSVKHSLVSNTV